MTTKVPTRVVLYAYAAEGSKAAAEFHWSEGSGVSLTVLDPEWAGLAEQYYASGVPLFAEERVVPPSDGPAFMRALLEPLNASYYGFIDESATSEEQ